MGVCQVKLNTARLMGFHGNAAKLAYPSINIYYAGKYLRHQLDRYQGNVPQAVASYNAGKCRFNKKGLIKNRKYVEKVLNDWRKH